MIYAENQIYFHFLGTGIKPFAVLLVVSPLYNGTGIHPELLVVFHQYGYYYYAHTKKYD